MANGIVFRFLSLWLAVAALIGHAIALELKLHLLALAMIAISDRNDW